jgi:hypothetical protein
MSLDTSTLLNESARRLFPDLEPDEVLAQLLLERAQRSLIKHQSQVHHFEAKYGQDFDTFRQDVLSGEPSAEREQDYFDWELAVTGVSDMADEIAQLQQLVPRRG